MGQLGAGSHAKGEYRATQNAILDNLARGKHRLSWTQLAHKLEISPSAVYASLRNMREKGLIPDNRLENHPYAKKLAQAAGPGNLSSDAPKSPNLTAEELLKQVEGQSLTSRPDRLRILSWIAENGQDASRIRAIETLEAFERSAGTQYGPPPPTTDDDIHRHLVALFIGLSPEQIAKAAEVAFAQNPEEPEAAEMAPSPGDSDLGGHDAPSGLRGNSLGESGDSDPPRDRLSSEENPENSDPS